jgi:hypothetical protein
MVFVAFQNNQLMKVTKSTCIITIQNLWMGF